MASATVSTTTIVKPIRTINTPSSASTSSLPLLIITDNKKSQRKPFIKREQQQSKKTTSSAPNTPQKRRKKKSVKEITNSESSSCTESDESNVTSKNTNKKTKKRIQSNSNQKSKKTSALDITITATTSALFTNNKHFPTNNLIRMKRHEHLLLRESTTIHRQRSRRKSTSIIDMRKTSDIYAGPTFTNNAPAPSALPIPFSNTNKQQSRDLLDLLKHKKRHSTHEFDLTEIQKGLRSMLKI
ncbi:uncharacterized protein BX663DRAFT_560847 [Cokeromyces recurvatus]|uniref:uncharacterized protein n=1 Tax=Cokeromyces recurvatus TaxID=90255 RepID=UPI00221E4ECB|nr:uncharacterized protein BX663DRAFT_560847 [Cokeromyces recurvatus]KAI7903333.1 hypothetical protein BX663DRAFT_560847 [Cokeromyces recurvatus]